MSALKQCPRVEACKEVASMRKELAEWRSGKRRIHWRLRFLQAVEPMETYIDYVGPNGGRRLAERLLEKQAPKLVRVTVRSKGAKR